MKAKKVLVLACVIVLTLSLLAGCASSNNGGNIATNNTSGSNTPNTSNKNVQEPEEPFELTIMANLHTPEVPSDTVEKLIEEKTNTDLKFQWVPDSNYVEKLNTAFATGSLPQAVFMKNQTTYVLFRDALRNDQFWEIGPYLDEFPNLSKLKETVVQNTAVDGKVYAIYQGRPLSRQGMIYRTDWAANLGLSAPTNTDELYEMMRAFTEDDPDGNGKDDTIGLADRSDLVYGAFKTVASWFGTPNNWGVQDGKVVPEFMFPEYIQTMDYFRDLRAKGYINQDFPVTSKPDQQAMFDSGKAGVYIGSMGDVKSRYDKAVELNPDVMIDVHTDLAGPDGEKHGMWSIPGYGNLVLFPKNAVKDEAELKKILGFFDKLMSKEVADLLYWGIEGTHHVITDGRAERTADAATWDRDVKPYQAIEVGEPETNGRYEGYHTYEPMAKAEELYKLNEQNLINDPTVSLDSPTYTEKGVQLQDIMKDASYRYMLGDINKDGFEKAIQQWKDQGGQLIMDEYTEAYNALN